jgi:hypothetical protein
VGLVKIIAVKRLVAKRFATKLSGLLAMRAVTPAMRPWHRLDKPVATGFARWLAVTADAELAALHLAATGSPPRMPSPV